MQTDKLRTILAGFIYQADMTRDPAAALVWRNYQQIIDYAELVYAGNFSQDETIAAISGMLDVARQVLGDSSTKHYLVNKLRIDDAETYLASINT